MISSCLSRRALGVSVALGMVRWASRTLGVLSSAEIPADLTMGCRSLACSSLQNGFHFIWSRGAVLQQVKGPSPVWGSYPCEEEGIPEPRLGVCVAVPVCHACISCLEPMQTLSGQTRQIGATSLLMDKTLEEDRVG